ncbi:hypothetical protein [uncultured Cetobacterium sp.]|uniref:hypothetical protein n=1 Tax=uncultured Cetobacterium sp. TaxID=527638 RepID=UPI002612708C|nr:hypothetical protein [uncultured Cetobacterium sp.]
MTKLKKKSYDNWMETETIETGETFYRDEDVSIDEKLVKNKSLIRVEMNLVQFPIFSKNTSKKKNEITTYFFNKNKSTYIRVTPQAGDYIPGEMEEKIFIALMQLMKENGMPRKIIITASELKNKLKMTTGDYKKYINKSLSRLASTAYIFNNTLYSSKLGGVINDKIETSIFNIRTINLDKKQNEQYRMTYTDRRVKEIYEIEFSEHFYNNIMKKGYMVYDGDMLLEIESSTARTIYMLIEKLRFSELYLKIDTIFLIKRIPLKFDKRNFPQTIKTLTKAFEGLKSKKLIVDFKFIKSSTWENSEIEIYFPETATIEKQDRFFEDLNDFRKISKEFAISEMEHSKLDKNIENDENVVITSELINKVLNLMPMKARLLKTMQKTIRESIELYGYKKVELTARYMKAQKVDKIRSYFLKALENNWIEDEIEILDRKTLSASKQESLNFVNESTPSYDESLFEYFKELSQDIQDGIETYAYRDYVKECGIETKIQKLAFMGSRKMYICKYLEKYPNILGEKDKIVEIKEVKDEILTNFIDIKERVLNVLEINSEIYSVNGIKLEEIKSEILKEIRPYVLKKILTYEILENIINSYFEN